MVISNQTCEQHERTVCGFQISLLVSEPPLYLTLSKHPSTRFLKLSGGLGWILGDGQAS